MSVRVETENRVALVTLDDPRHRNALTAEVSGALSDAVDRLEAEDVGAMVITGAPPAFCAGADLAALEQADGPALREIYRGFLSVHRSHIPSIAAINGATVGAGVNLALACDLRLVSQTATIDTGFLKLDIHPGGGHTWLLQQELGVQATFALTVFGERLDGAEAERRGFAWRCVADDELLPLARELAGRAARHPAELVRTVARTIREMASVDDHDDAVEIELDRQIWSVRQPAFREAVTAMRTRIESKASRPNRDLED
jgi:enoyl-CoA hydratase